MYFFEKERLFSAQRVRSYFRGEAVSSFLMRKEISFSSVVYLERPSFQNIWKKNMVFRAV